MATLIGPHTLEIEEDLIIIRLNGSFLLEHMKEWCSAADQIIAKYGVAFTISDLRTAGHFPPESRNYAAAWTNSQKVFGTALFGSGIPMRVLIIMIARAIALVKKHTIPMTSVATESEARTWIEARRRLYSTTKTEPADKA